MPGRKIIIGSRGSPLALWQARLAKALMWKYNPDLRIDIQIIRTRGDIIQDAPLARIGDKGLFTREIENALLQGNIDLAVHSLKDLPTELPEELEIGAVLERADPRDAFVSYLYSRFQELPRGAVLATSSLRRRANLLHLRPDLRLVELRGNVDTRLRKLQKNGYDGMILAVAGMTRLGYGKLVKEILPSELMLPAVSQGALAVEIRQGDTLIEDCVKPLHHHKTHIAVTAERAFLKRLQGGCQVPIGALAEIKNKQLHLQGFLSDLKGEKYLRSEIQGPLSSAETLGTKLAEQLLQSGGNTILDAIYHGQERTITR